MGDMQTMAIDRNAVCELAPEGKLRAGVVRAPQGGVFFVSVDEQAQPVGVTVDLIRQFARDLQLEPVFGVFPNSGECTDAVASGGIDNLEQVKELAAAPEPNLIGVISGRAVYEGTLDLAEAAKITKTA